MVRVKKLKEKGICAHITHSYMPGDAPPRKFVLHPNPLCKAKTVNPSCHYLLFFHFLPPHNPGQSRSDSWLLTSPCSPCPQVSLLPVRISLLMTSKDNKMKHWYKKSRELNQRIFLISLCLCYAIYRVSFSSLSSSYCCTHHPLMPYI